VRADGLTRLRVRGERTSDIAGLSPHGRVVLARLERKRFWPGKVETGLRLWEEHLRGPYRRLYDPHYEGCGVWECCTPIDELRELLAIVEHHLPRRDARRLRARLENLDELW
jgi:hypothetical protein